MVSKLKIFYYKKMHSLDFRASAPEAASPVPTLKNPTTISKIMNEQKKFSDEKELEKRAASPSTSSTVKPPYSYIALSN